ncbi:MAG: OadG family protein [Firmicutes bacterium]|nr:OadG family protein [Bacillota bacterium]
MEVTTTGPALAISTLTFGEGVLYAILGMLVVFFALVLIMVIIKILIKATDKKEAAPAAAAEVPAEAAAEPPAPVKRDDPAPGSAGEIKLYTTDPKEAAMIMAIVADALGKPLNELRFKSIREIKE